MRLDLLNCYPHWEHPSYDLKQLFELSYLRRGLSLAPFNPVWYFGKGRARAQSASLTNIISSALLPH
uniref:Uncharacterized protein n=1 Tax=Picea glauca TaxID=3330 RepID=A0A117NFN5_PICGL|nr:hypothetical protein ABT39_MTgene2647 [Picea glauca]QHR88087.1 hypothetical protein Q903MT_gene2100 [Picea sitchensis]